MNSGFAPPRGTGVAFVTGAGGFIGAAAASAFGRAGWRVAAFGRAPRWPDVGLGHLRPPLWSEGDVLAARLSEAAAAFGRPEVLFHAAGGASVGASLADPAADRRRTMESLGQALVFLEAEAPRARLIYPSSAAVYGEGAPGPIPEDAPLKPVSPYGVHKLEAETSILEAAGRFGLDAVIIRFFSVYGPGLRKQLLWELANRLLPRPAEIELSGQGDEIRDFLAIDDAVGLIGLAAGLERQPTPLIVNGGTGRPVTVRRAAETLCAALGRRTRIIFNGKVREGDPRSLVADVSRARRLGFEPAVPFDEGVGRLAGWLGAGPRGQQALPLEEGSR